MHRPRSAEAAFSIKLGAYLILITSLMIVTNLGMFGYAVYQRDKSLMVIGGIAVLASLLFFLIAHLTSNKARCPLCMNPILHSRRCQRHRKARRFLGSYRLLVARDIVISNKFICPYCGESTLCIARENRK